MPSKKIPVQCPGCLRTRYLRPYDARKVNLCRQCQSRAVAGRGGAVTVARHGVRAMVKHQYRYRLANPSNLEIITAVALDLAGYEYEREFWFEIGRGKHPKIYLVDFVIYGAARPRFIECNGNYYHAKHAARDEAKMAAMKRRGWRCYALGDTDILTAQADTAGDYLPSILKHLGAWLRLVCRLYCPLVKLFGGIVAPLIVARAVGPLLGWLPLAFTGNTWNLAANLATLLETK